MPLEDKGARAQRAMDVGPGGEERLQGVYRGGKAALARSGGWCLTGGCPSGLLRGLARNTAGVVGCAGGVELRQDRLGLRRSC